MSAEKSIAILLFAKVEVLDFAGPLEVFSRARSYPSTDGATRALCKVFTVAEKLEALRCANPLTVVPDYDFETCPPVDLLLVPGGYGTRTCVDQPKVIEWIAKQAATTELILSVCTGALLLAKAGILDGKSAVTYHNFADNMQHMFPTVRVQKDCRWVDEGNVITAAGVSAGIDMALYVVKRLFGEAIASATARGMEYESWNSTCQRPDTRHSDTNA